ncbi:MAG: hypothetical protein ABSE74_00860 [Methanoregula sp.]
MLLLPSPKLQLHDAGDPVDASVNVIKRGADPDVGEAEKTGNGMVVAVAAKLYLSPGTGVDVPLGVVTSTSTGPTVVLAGVVAVISVALTTTRLVTAVPPTVAAVAPVKPVPVMVIAVLVETGPYAGETVVTVGIAVYVNAPVSVNMPPGVVMTRLAAPAVPAGVIAVIEVELTTPKLVAATPPNVTAVVPVKPLPVIITNVPPAVEPIAGETLVNVGAEAV